MKSGTWGTWNRRLVCGLLGVTTMLGSILTTVQAAEASADAPQISPWSVQELHEGEKYGIFPVSWYYDGGFQQPITVDKLNALFTATVKKLDALGFPKAAKASATSAPVAGATREAVLRSLYSALAQYELPAAFGLPAADELAYLQQHRVVSGTAQGLELSRPCTVEQAAVLASRLVAYAYEKAGGGAQGLMWKVTHGNNTLYLLGSIHMGSSDMYPMNRKVRDAYAASDALWVEANLQTKDKEAIAYFTKLTTYHDGTTLKGHISAQTYEKLQKVSDRLGLPTDVFTDYKPWVVSNSVTMSSLLNASENMAQAAAMGIDMYFIRHAILDDKPVRELEGIKFQGDLFNNVPAEEQEKELNQALDAVLNPTTKSEGADAFKLWQTQWTKGDLDGFTKSFSASQQFVQSETAKRLFGERDKNMAGKLTELLEKDGSSTTFVVVGAGHFVIKDMVIDQLKQKGFHVEFVQ